MAIANKITEEYHNLIVEMMKAIISNPEFKFDQMDMKPYFNRVTQGYDPKMKYELTVLEAKRFADALMALES